MIIMTSLHFRNWEVVLEHHLSGKMSVVGLIEAIQQVNMAVPKTDILGPSKVRVPTSWQAFDDLEKCSIILKLLVILYLRSVLIIATSLIYAPAGVCCVVKYL